MSEAIPGRDGNRPSQRTLEAPLAVSVIVPAHNEESVIAEVSRYTPVEIVIADPSLRDMKIGGYFRTGDTEVLLDTLASSFGVEADHIRPGLIYLRPISP